MKNLYMTNYSVKGIKSLDQWVSLSFYKKVISNPLDTSGYNVKGIYGMNGSGKSAIVISANVLRKILTMPGYLNNPMVQKTLGEIINKKVGELSIQVDFLTGDESALLLFRYSVTISTDITGKYFLAYEELSVKKATSKSESMDTVFKVINGEIVFLMGGFATIFADMLIKRTANLTTTSSLCMLFIEKIFLPEQNKIAEYNCFTVAALCELFRFGMKLHAYIEQGDDHRNYLAHSLLATYENEDSIIDDVARSIVEMGTNWLNVLSDGKKAVSKKSFIEFLTTVEKLCEFLRIFKPDLKNIEIDRKEDKDLYICELIMVYDDYKINAEFESTGIKKLIKLYAYIQEMDRGGIVFIDELDANLHDVYLCALLEYLMKYGKGQLCFTTHNVGPMDVLKQHKKSIDFLSANHMIYPWRTSGNYSPSKLYRNGMIEGSPFNVDSIDFIGVFDTGEEDE